MEIGRMNQVSSAVSAIPDKSYDAPAKRAAPAESGAPAEKSAGSASGDLSAQDATKLCITKLEKDMTDTEQEGGDATTEEFLQQLIDKVNNRLVGGHRAFDYSRHQKTGQLMVKIIDRETKEVVREIPPEKTLDAVARMWDMMGIFVDNKT